MDGLGAVTKEIAGLPRCVLWGRFVLPLFSHAARLAHEEGHGGLQDRFQLLLQGAAVPLGAQFQPFFVEMIAPILYPVQELNRKTHEYASCVFLRAFSAGTTGLEPAIFGLTGRHVNRYTTSPVVLPVHVIVRR